MTVEVRVVVQPESELKAARARITELEQALDAWVRQDTETLLDTLHIIGIPARDLRDIYQVVGEWRKNGGRPELLETLRERAALRDTVAWLADLHHRTVDGSRLHRPTTQDWRECECRSCQRAQEVLGGV